MFTFTKDKIRKKAFLIFSLICLAGIGACFICNIAMEHKITWAAYPMSSIPFLWFTVFPLLLLKKNSVLLSIILFCFTTFPFLYFLNRITPSQGWFYSLALPTALIGTTALVITYLLFQYLKINKWYVSSIVIFLFTVVVSPLCEYFVDRFLGESSVGLDNIITVFIGMTVAAVLSVIGYFRSRKDQKKNE